ncbi:MAG: DUF3786 domain-containing protein [Lachnospiraceae bacterium]|nr:DUF3786 domain-containing protein [Lachnospiraceae bacterium]
MRNRMRGEFVKYDQEKMIRKFSLNSDAEYIYITFVSEHYRINRKNGIVERSDDDFRSVTEAGYNESMTIYDVLCCSKENCRLSGRFCPVHMAKGAAKTFQAGGRMFQKSADSFQGRIKQLEYACSILGERAEMKGDAASVIYAFPFLPVVFQFWDGDDEFPPNLKFMFDENILDYMHFETVFFMMSHILKRMETIVNGEAFAS